MLILSYYQPKASALLYTLADGSPLMPEANHKWILPKRHWGRLLAIHAAENLKDVKMLEGCRECRARGWCYRGRLEPKQQTCSLSGQPCIGHLLDLLAPLGDLRQLPRGVILGVVRIAIPGCVAPWQLPTRSPFAVGPWLHLYEDRRTLRKPIEWKGSQGLRMVDDEIFKGAEWL